MKTQKCCTHCPGKLVPPGNNEFHECCQPPYVSGNLKISSLKKHVSDCPRRRETQEDRRELLPMYPSTCCEQFAMARRLHAENLEHQPLPDKVDDSVFKNARPVGSCCASSREKCCDCCKQKIEGRAKSLGKLYGPVLGCKEPKTKMDLAISWETPIDPIYEPARPTHIDGSEGGLAPAVFSLVQHSSTSEETVRSGVRRKEKDHCTNANEKEDRQNVKCCCDCLCKGLKGVNISRRAEDRSRGGSFRKCVACQARKSKEDPRLIKSVVGLALGTERVENSERKRRNETTTVPRPRTPFARRSFCIDTLTPPFSAVNGRRDADYPEHWRLMSVYQQSYRNPYKRRNHRY